MQKPIIFLVVFTCVTSLPVRHLFKRQINKRDTENYEDERYLRMMRDEMFRFSGKPLYGRLTAQDVTSFFRHMMGLNVDLSVTIGRDYIREGDKDGDGRLDRSELLGAMRVLRILRMDHYV